MTKSELQQISEQIETLLVAKDLRGMMKIKPELTAGYCLRAAKILQSIKGTVLIGTGFPVVDTFETDGPVGALALYKVLEHLGAHPVLVCGTPMANFLQLDYRVHVISVGSKTFGKIEAERALDHFQPEAVVSIERPGLSDCGSYFNMRGEDISARAACFDYFVTLADCPTIAIGDGGNEIGMGNVYNALNALDIVASTTQCDELLVADVSNWGVYGIVGMLGMLTNKPLLELISPEEILAYLSSGGSVDGVTRLNELTEDSLPVEHGLNLINDIKQLTAQN